MGYLIVFVIAGIVLAWAWQNVPVLLVVPGIIAVWVVVRALLRYRAAEPERKDLERRMAGRTLVNVGILVIVAFAATALGLGVSNDQHNTEVRKSQLEQQGYVQTGTITEADCIANGGHIDSNICVSP